MRILLWLLLAILVASHTPAGADPGSGGPVAVDSSRSATDDAPPPLGIGEPTAALLASEDVTRIDFRAGSRQQAMALIRTTVDSYLSTVGGALADSGQVSPTALAAMVIRGLETCRIWQTVVLDPAFQNIVVESPEDAAKTGEFLGQVAALVVRTTDGRREMMDRRAAGRILDQIVVDTDSEEPLLDQCLIAAWRLAALSDESLDRRLTNHDR
jgi:hypothetical protein